MMIQMLHIFAILCVAAIVGKLISKFKLPAILGWLITGIVFGPYLAEIVSLDIINTLWYKIFIKFFECFAGVMIGREIIFRKIASSGKQIIGITRRQIFYRPRLPSFRFLQHFLFRHTLLQEFYQYLEPSQEALH